DYTFQKAPKILESIINGIEKEYDKLLKSLNRPASSLNLLIAAKIKADMLYLNTLKTSLSSHIFNCLDNAPSTEIFQNSMKLLQESQTHILKSKFSFGQPFCELVDFLEFAAVMNKKDPPPPDEKQDVFSLGCMIMQAVLGFLPCMVPEQHYTGHTGPAFDKFLKSTSLSPVENEEDVFDGNMSFYKGYRYYTPPADMDSVYGLLYDMLNPDPYKRPDMERVRNHPWIKLMRKKPVNTAFFEKTYKART
ncbi:hypothetical protein ACFL96_19745, partial [Thermoproteota archaeon]